MELTLLSSGNDKAVWQTSSTTPTRPVSVPEQHNHRLGKVQSGDGNRYTPAANIPSVYKDSTTSGVWATRHSVEFPSTEQATSLLKTLGLLFYSFSLYLKSWWMGLKQRPSWDRLPLPTSFGRVSITRNRFRSRVYSSGPQSGGVFPAAKPGVRLVMAICKC